MEASITSAAVPSVQHTNDEPWYDKLAPDDGKPNKPDDINSVTNEGEVVFERVEQQVNGSVKPQ